MRAALGWAMEQDDPELGLELVGALHQWFHWYAVGEGRRGAEALLARPGASRRTTGRAKVLRTAAGLAYVQTDYRAAARCGGESVALFRALGNQHDVMWAQVWLVVSFAGPVTGQQTYERACALGAACVAYYRQVGDLWHLAASLLGLGILVSSRGDVAGARSLVEESATLFRELGDSWWGGAALYNLALLALREGDHHAARGFCEETLELSLKAGNRGYTGFSLHLLAHLLQREGEHTRAEPLLREALLRLRELGVTRETAWCLDGLAGRGPRPRAGRAGGATVRSSSGAARDGSRARTCVIARAHGAGDHGAPRGARGRALHRRLGRGPRCLARRRRRPGPAEYE